MNNPLFKDTVTVTDIRGTRGNEIFSFVGGSDAVRVLHRDKPIKVIITEEFYLNLLTFWQSHAENKTATSSREELKARAQAELSSINKNTNSKRVAG
jgi:hypothetical protein